MSYQLIILEGIAPCNHEEADSPIFLHARHAVEQGHTSLIIKASDTDVLVIAINVFQMALKSYGSPLVKDQICDGFLYMT